MFQIEKITRHTDDKGEYGMNKWKKRDYEHSLAVLETKQQMPVGDRLEAAMLPENTDSLDDKDITVGSWGWTSKRGSRSLDKYQVISTTTRICGDSYGIRCRPGMFCAGTNNHTPCSGDDDIWPATSCCGDTCRVWREL